ncbi:TFIIS-type domain-containing protein [Pseudozyma hubeiensis]|nr:TFIIS-type domain-containing protein [Pseudozyma hubeiensis]
MCVIFWTTNDPHYHLIIASNRDEYLSRPTLPASWHDFSSPTSSSTATSSVSPSVLSARDSTGGGTWLGVTRNGSWASLTNFTEQSAPLPEGLTAFESRGALVRDWLVSQTASKGEARELEQVQQDIEGYLSQVGSRADRYPGFNLLIAALSSSGMVVGYTTNRTSSGGVSLHTPPTIFSPTSNTPSPNGLSNSIITSPWSKVSLGSRTFTSILSSDSTELQEQLFDLLWTSSHPPPTQRSELRNSILISPLHLPGVKDAYATRTSTIILIGKDGSCSLVERDTFGMEGGEVVRINGGQDSGAIKGRSAGQRVFDWQIE